MKLSPVRTQSPTEYPVSLDEAKAHLRVDIDDEDDLIEALIAAATEHVEISIGKALVAQTWAQSFAAFCAEMRLPLEPVLSVESVLYFDSDNEEQLFPEESYHVLTDILGPRLVLSTGATWPGTYGREDAITVEFVVGYGDAAEDVPAPLRQAIKLLVGHWYENREPTAGAAMSGLWNEIPYTVEALIAPYRRKKF